MAENDVFPRPSFVIDTDDDAPELRLRSMESDIYQRPGVYHRLVQRLGSTLTNHTIGLSEQSIHPQQVRDNAAHRLHEFFTYRYDRMTEFDDKTEAAIASDASYRELLAQHKASHNYTVALSAMSHQLRPDPNAEPIRDQLRRKRLELFIGRVMAWQDSQQTEQPAPHRKQQLRTAG